MTQPRVIFSHGLGGEPWGAKIMAMADVAQAMGCAVESVDYRDTDDPMLRVERLQQFASRFDAPPILVGSSLGGHVAAACSVALRARGLFLLAPAFYMPGYEQHTPVPAACPISIVHGWHDDIVPVANSIRYAREHRATLQVVDGDHRLLAHIPQITNYWRMFLQGLLAPRGQP